MWIVSFVHLSLLPILTFTCWEVVNGFSINFRSQHYFIDIYYFFEKEKHYCLVSQPFLRFESVDTKSSIFLLKQVLNRV